MTENEYTKQTAVAYSDLDIHDFILPSRYLGIFQDAAGEHAELLGCGYEAFKSKDLMWIIVRSRLDILGNPKENETLKVTTKVKRPVGVIFEREIKICSLDGSVYATGLTDWCVSNRVTRRLVRPSDIPYPSQFDGPYIYEKHLSSIKPFKPEGDPVLTHRVRFTDLDHNLHMNNCKYADVLEDAISPKAGQRFIFLEMNYEKECVEGDILSLYINPDEKEGFWDAMAYKQDGSLSFKARYSLTKAD